VARPDKVAAVEDVKERLTSSAATLLTNYRGLTVSELAELRAELRKANASYRVAKNTLTLIAARDAGMDGLEELLTGPTALVFCDDDPVGPAKALKAFAKDHPELEFKGGYLDGAVLDAVEALKLADLASREELLTKLAGLMYGALANTARLLNALPEKQARLMQALVDAGGYAGAPADAAPAEAAEEPADEPAAETADEPAAETADEPAVEAADEPAAEAADEPAAEAAEEPAADESAAEAADEPAAEATDEPSADDETTA
jgi:large subunit ribosomal protein L10